LTGAFIKQGGAKRECVKIPWHSIKQQHDAYLMKKRLKNVLIVTSQVSVM